MAVAGNATVKAVLSGDTLVLIGRSTGGPPPELQLNLAGLIAPKVGRGQGTTEEPWAFESREFLRNLAIGKTASFKVDFKAGPRSFGTVLIDGESVNAAVAREGWARVKYGDPQREGEAAGEAEEMKRLSSAAESAKKGIFAGPGRARAILWTGINSSALLASNKGMPVRVIIEHVRDGSSLRCMLLKESALINFSLAGISCPRVNAPRSVTPQQPTGVSNEDVSTLTYAISNLSIEKNDQPEPFAAEARHFVEMRLLNRELDILLEGCDKYENLYGTVLHEKGNISIELIRAGLAKMSDWTAGFLPREVAMAMRSAENEAKRAQLRLWKGWTPPSIKGAKEYTANVIEVHSGDQVTIVVRDSLGERVERRLALASVKAPKIGNPKRNVQDESWALESKESLRSQVIGKTVKITVEYERDVPQGEGAAIRRQFVTLEYGKGSKMKNIAEVLLSEGLLTVVRHRQDEPRSPHYETLVTVEQEAKAAKRCIHSDQPSPPHRTADLTGDSKKAKQHFPHLQRAGPGLHGLVEHVFSGSRFKVYVPSENVSFMMALSSIRCPNVGREGRQGDVGGDEARAYSRDNLMQRNVEVEVVDMDKNGIALGVMHVGQGELKHDYAVELLKAGLARCDERAIERLGSAGQQLLDAENSARILKLGLHSAESISASAPDSERASEISEEVALPSELVQVRLSDMEDGGTFYLQIDSQHLLEQVEAKMAALKMQVGTSGATMDHRRGAPCAALFDAGDGKGECWYRARIEGLGRSGSGSVTVRYIDHGNCATIPVTKLRPLDRSYFDLPPLAKECSLAYTRVPTLSDDLGRDAASLLQEMTWGKILHARLFGKDRDTGRIMVALYQDGEQSINEIMIGEGCARLIKRAEQTAAAQARGGSPAGLASVELVTRLKEAQHAAHKGRIGMWIYGDCTSDDEN